MFQLTNSVSFYGTGFRIILLETDDIPIYDVLWGPGTDADLGRLQHRFQLLHRRIFVETFDSGEFTHQPVEGGLIDLPFAIRLIRLPGVAVQIAHNLGN